MLDPSASGDAGAVDQAWRRLEALLDETARRAKSACAADQFYGPLLEGTVAASGARGGAVWRGGDAGSLRRSDLVGPAGLDALTSRAAHRAFVHQVTAGGRPLCIRPAAYAEHDAAGCEAQAICLCPVVVDDQVLAVLELFVDPATGDSSEQNYITLLSALADTAVEFHRYQQLRELRGEQARRDALDAFAHDVHRHLDIEQTCYALANGARPLVEADRVSVLVARGSRYRLRAISGIDVFDRRAPDVIALERLARAAGRVGEAIWSEDEAPRPPQLQQPLERYLDGAGVRCLALLPLPPTGKDATRPCGWLAVERFQGDGFDPPARRNMQAVCRHGAAALRNALALDGLPLLWLSRLLRRLARLLAVRHLPKTLLVALVLAALVTALLVVPVDFVIRARGELQPRQRRDVFAAADGVVDATHVQHGDLVTAGQPLVSTRNLELEYEYQRLLGEIDTTRTRLQSLGPATSQPADPREVAEAVAEQERLRVLLANLVQQRAILESQRAELLVCSPIDGQVLSWDVDKLLASRPLRRGQKLMTVAAASGPWQLEVRVADQDVGPVLAARPPDGGPAVSYILLAEPAVVRQGVIRSIAQATDASADAGPSVLVIVEVDADELSGARPGASVIANIHCGRRPCGYVWLRGLIEAVRTRLLF